MIAKLKNNVAYGLIGVSLFGLLPSCEVLNDSAASAGLGGAVGAIAGSQIDKNNRGRGALLGGGLGALAGYALSQHYKASQRQIASARAAALRAEKDPKVTKSKKRYIAVAVPKQKGEGKDIMVYDTQKKEMASDNVYVPDSNTSYRKGDDVNVGGKRAVVASSFQGV